MKLTFDVPDELVRDIKTAVEDYIKLKQFPQQGDDFYFVCANGAIGHDTFARYATRDYGMYNFGNCFRTKEEAEFKREQLKVLHELEQLVADDHSNKNGNYSYVYIIYNWENGQCCAVPSFSIVTYTPFHFKTVESAQKAINQIGKARLKKYYFCIPEEE